KGGAMAHPGGRNGRSHALSAAVKATVPAQPGHPVRKVGKNGSGTSANALIHELGTCVTEADLLQVLYRGLQARFDYNAINLQVLEREGWYHSLVLDNGVLQDVRRRPLRESTVAKFLATPKTPVLPIERARLQSGRGPGVGVTTGLAIGVPVMHQRELIGSAISHTSRKRGVPPAEIAFLEDV